MFISPLVLGHSNPPSPGMIEEVGEGEELENSNMSMLGTAVAKLITASLPSPNIHDMILVFEPYSESYTPECLAIQGAIALVEVSIEITP